MAIELGGLRGRVNEPKFVESAPEDVVEETRANLALREAEDARFARRWPDWQSLARVAEMGARPHDSGGPWRNFYGRIKGKTMNKVQQVRLETQLKSLPGAVGYEENPIARPLTQVLSLAVKRSG